ncbi:efflux RND transporter periplasmic adaptor subunit [Ottowia thiooxydans]|uniref:efflux RND transporter periplasmic adaptor subunit n=1 Tax=Ottowia thiooxydans TaxID=219182 RepID=UPI00055B194B|nr:efflux RND transporter periplasmic adaptor subunit [Ottowia thiooxydans]
MNSPQLLCVLAMAALLAACSGDKKSADAPQAAASAPRPVLTVTAEKPRRVSMTDALAANGSIAAWQEAIIGADVPGLRLADIRVNVGDVVKKGQVLATFDAAPIQQDQAQARASLAEAEAAAADAAGNAERARAVASSGALSQQQINQYLTAEKTARARADAARAVMASQGLRLRNTQVLAPDDGVISARTATVGQVAGSGAELFRLVRRGRLEWRAEVTSEDLTRVRIGQRVQIELPGGAQVTGTTRQLAPTVDAKTRYGLVYVDLPSGSPARAGMFARGNFELGQGDALTVAQEAVVMRDGFAHVLRVGNDQRVQLARVQTGRIANNRIEIKQGLDDTLPVAVRGAGFLNDGDLVQVTEGPTPAPLAAASNAAMAPASAPAK